MGKRPSPFATLKYPNFRLFLVGSFFSQVGDQMQIVAVAWQVYALTHSAASLGLVGVVEFLPIVLLSLVGGVIADKWNRKKLLMVGQTILSLLTLILFLLTSSNQITVPAIYLVLLASSIVNAFTQPARQAILPLLVPRETYIGAASLNTTQRQLGTIIGPAIAGILIAGYGVGMVYLINFISFFVQIITLLPLKFTQATQDKVNIGLKSALEGVKFVKNSPIIFSTMILDFLATFFGYSKILMPIFALDILKVGASGLGLLYAAEAIGGVVAGLGVSAVPNLRSQGKVVAVSVIIYGLSMAAFGLSRDFALSLFFLTIGGAADIVSTVVRSTIRQLTTPDFLRGRMTSISVMFARGGPKIGDAEAGFLAAVIGGPLAVVVGGVGVVFVATLMLIKIKALRDYEGDE